MEEDNNGYDLWEDDIVPWEQFIQGEEESTFREEEDVLKAIQKKHKLS